ncbi:Imm1 family immunity protein [Lentzea sp. HUAS12]|uniref:Imm1 family immunity protein n=1 Tax=Lentzea sp. HUAS12 TaxID=2951806 RepID=UPI0020A1F451|nr:Imm1 family immunity protein [Lentzea sp. HUAS12]USX50918.1 Imm1 family immunity protein [Lentzea sp. HUAS12]
MKHSLNFWYFTDTNDADDPVTVESDSDLERVLGEVHAHEQFHPTVVCVKDRPTLEGPLNLPDHQLKFDIDVPHRIAAIHTMGPPSFLPADVRDRQSSEQHSSAEGMPEDVMRAWVTKGSYARATAVRLADDHEIDLFVDFDTRTRFPADAAISWGKLREALKELAETGLRPTCVDWQESDIY